MSDKAQPIAPDRPAAPGLRASTTSSSGRGEQPGKQKVLPGLGLWHSMLLHRLEQHHSNYSNGVSSRQ